MKKIEKHIKKQRNDTDTQVKKYKQDLDAIGIKYDHKSAHVEVPNHATGGFEYFKWDWMTSTTGSHSEIVQIFKKIVSTLKETKNNPAQYENLVSNLDASTKNALDVNIKKHNITVPQSSETLQPVNDVISLLQKYSIGYDGSMVQIQSIDYTNWKIPLQNISSDDPMFGYAIRAYDAVKTSNQSLFNQNYKELDVNGLVILRNIPFVSHKESTPMSTVQQAAEFIKNSGIVLPLPEEYKEVLQEYTNEGQQ